MLVKFSSLAGGVFIEVSDADTHEDSARCFRFDENGNAEYALYGDLQSNNPSPRWFGHCYTSDDFRFA